MKWTIIITSIIYLRDIEFKNAHSKTLYKYRAVFTHIYASGPAKINRLSPNYIEVYNIYLQI